MGFNPTRFDPDICIRGREGGYNYIRTHTNDVLVVSVNPTSIFEKLKENYTIKKIHEVPHYHCSVVIYLQNSPSQVSGGGHHIQGAPIGAEGPGGDLPLHLRR